MAEKDNIYYFPNNLDETNDDYEEEYRKNKKDSKKKKSWKKFFLFLLLIIISYLLMSLPYFNVKNISCTGNINASSEKIIKLANVSKETNIFFPKKKEIKERLKALTIIKEVQIIRKLPNTLVLKVKEHKPVGLLVCEDGFIEVSETGIFLSLSSQIGEYKLPFINGIKMEKIPGPGQVIENKGLKIALNILEKVSPELLANLVEINVKDFRNIVAYTDQGIEIRLGTEDKMEEKLVKLEEISKDIINGSADNSYIEYIDLRFSNFPVYKKKDF